MIKIVDVIIKFCFWLKLILLLIRICILFEVIILNSRKLILLMMGDGIFLINVDNLFIKLKMMVKKVVLLSI